MCTNEKLFSKVIEEGVIPMVTTVLSREILMFTLSGLVNNPLKYNDHSYLTFYFILRCHVCLFAFRVAEKNRN